jgi:quinol monooxygenase YgiN
MKVGRRAFVLGVLAAPAVASTPVSTERRATEGTAMYGLIGKMVAAPGQRDAVIAILLEGIAAMPGCLSYVVAIDPTNADAVWITEVWDNEVSHAASLKLPAVRAAITKAKPLIAGFGERFVTAPVGGHGLPPSR